MQYLTLYNRTESFNGLMRMQNVYGNKQAPSRDIANKFSKLESIRHVYSGNCFNDGRLL